MPLIFAFAYLDAQTLAMLKRYNEPTEKAGYDPATLAYVLSVLAGVSSRGDRHQPLRADCA